MLCLLAGLIYSAVLYFRNTRDHLPKKLIYLTAFVRFFVVSLMAILLLSPLVQTTSKQIEKPILIFAQDNSKSLELISDSTYYRSEYLSEINNFLKNLSSKFEIRSFAFGETFRRSETFDFEDRATDISQVLEGVGELFTNRNVGAVVLASDGIFNRGLSPVFASANLGYPVYALALGDTTKHKDLILKRIITNRITYLGNMFPVAVEIEAQRLAGKGSRLSVFREGKSIFSKNFSIPSKSHFETIRFELKAEKPGTHRYSVLLSPIDGEVSMTNNGTDFFIDVIDAKQQVLILGDAPHPDLGALKIALVNNHNFEVTTSLIDEFSESPEKYNLVILHQLPSVRNPAANLIKRLQQSKIPHMVVIGAQTDFRLFNDLQTGISVTPRTNDFTEATPSINSGFLLFGLDQTTTGLLPALPPLHVPFAEYLVGSGVQSLANQRIGAVITTQPLIAFSESGGQKIGIITGEGLWRWRIYSFAQTGSHLAFDDLVWRLVQYLSVSEDKGRFRVSTRNIVFENEPVIFETELYNPSFELVNQPMVNLIITNSDGLDYTFEMARAGNAYRLNAGMFPPGEYSFRCQTRLGDEVHQAQGKFSVLESNIEALQIYADHNTLFQVAENTGGQMFNRGQWDELAQALLHRDDIYSILYSKKGFKELIDYRLILILLITLIAIEWFVRKWSGGY